MSRIGLQVVLAAVALVALVTGTLGMATGALDPFFGIGDAAGSPGLVQLDSLYRSYDGLWLGLGVWMALIVPRVERHGGALRAMALLIFVGAIGRVVSMVQLGMPHPGFVAATVAELLFPLLVPWQRAVAANPAAPAPA